MLLAALMHILRRVIAGLGVLHRVFACLGALHPRPRRRVHDGGAGAGAAPASNVRSDVWAPGEGRQAVTIRVATLNAALFSMAPAVHATAVVPESGAGTRAESGADVVPRPKGILKAQASELPESEEAQASKARVLVDLQDKEMSLESSGSSTSSSPGLRRQPQVVAGADIIAVQNVRGMRPLSDLAGALGMQYVFAESWAPGYGNAVLSRWPIKRWKAVRVADHSDLR